jgi:DNA-binding NtrC family response regulator
MPGNPSLLVVDDESVIRDFLYEIFCDTYDVTLVTDGDEAIDCLKQRSFDLIITDLKMQRISGEEVVRFASQHRPECKVIVISGYSSLYAASQSVSHGASGFLSKPFSIKQLMQTVEQVTAGSGGSNG